MAGLMVSASTGEMRPLLGKLATLMGEEFTKLKNLRNEVKFISEELTSMKDALEKLSDLDELDKQTKGWRDQVREMSYGIEDIIDDFMRHVGEKSETDGFGRKTARLLKKLRARHQIAGQINEIKSLVLETSARRQRYKLDIPASSDVAIDPRVATLYENAANLVGVEGPTNELINLLIDKEKQLKVVSIVGFGGLGKTTLANKVYDRLKGDFDSYPFVPVSQKPDITKFLHGLLYELGGVQSFNDCELNVVLNKLRGHLLNKRYLIVIDDIWDAQAWGIIKCAFPENDLGSRLIATTRIQDVAKACSSCRHDYILQMKPLSNEDSRRLFFGRMFDSEEVCPHQIKDILVEILKKCGGLPLAIIIISGMLVSEGSNQVEWEHVRNSLGSGTNVTLERMRQILNLNYKNLPPHLKTCLLYLGMYPEDYTLQRSDLERQWMAEGFVSNEKGQDVEKVAKSYFNELVNRSLIQPAKLDSKGSVTQCKVHDMMLDLILFKSAEENFSTIVDGPQASEGLDHSVRRLSLRLDGVTSGPILPANISMSQVRTIMVFGSVWDIPLSEFKFLRVLFVPNNLQTYFAELCKLYHLRYVKITSDAPCKLPAQIRGLQHLETLDVWGCSYVPSDIVHLPSLLFLNLDYVRWFPCPGRNEPDGIGKRKSLRYLYAFDLEKNSLENIEGLGELNNLRHLTVTMNAYPADRERRMDALCSSLGKICANLEYLSFDIMGCMDAMMGLSPPPRRLERLHISSFSVLPMVPNWIGELSSLRELTLIVDELPKDGVGILAELPSLTMGGRAFPVLKRFKLHICSALYLAFQAGAMVMLQRFNAEFYAKGLE